MRALVVGRVVLTSALAVLVAITATHLMLDLLPGDAAVAQLGSAGAAAVAQARTEWGLTAGVLPRFVTWLGGLVRGDFGLSRTPDRRAVLDLLDAPLQRSVFLVLMILVLACLIGIPVGIAAGLRAGSRVDKTLSTSAMVIIGIPEFVLGALLIAILAVRLRWFEAVSLVPLGEPVWAHPRLLVLPALTVALPAGAMLARMVRAVVIDQAHAPHVEAAHLAGLAPRQILRRHLLPGAWPAVGQVLAMMVPALLGGTIVAEKLYGFPGLGSLLVEHVAKRDTPTVTVTVGVIAVITVVSLHLADRRAHR